MEAADEADAAVEPRVLIAQQQAFITMQQGLLQQLQQQQVQWMPVSSVKYAQDSIKMEFCDNRSLDELVHQLWVGLRRVEDPFLILRCMVRRRQSGQRGRSTVFLRAVVQIDAIYCWTSTVRAWSVLVSSS